MAFKHHLENSRGMRRAYNFRSPGARIGEDLKSRKLRPGSFELLLVSSTRKYYLQKRASGKVLVEGAAAALDCRQGFKTPPLATDTFD